MVLRSNGMPSHHILPHLKPWVYILFWKQFKELQHSWKWTEFIEEKPMETVPSIQQFLNEQLLEAEHFHCNICGP
jgi:hypothetical protein